MNRTTIASLTLAGALLAGAGAASATDGVHSASTPERTPMVTTPFVATPSVSTGPISTPAQGADLWVAPVQLPTSVSADLDGLVDEDLTTPAATPEVSAPVLVPEISVADDVSVPAIEVSEIPVQVELPAAATVGTDGAHAWSTALPVGFDATGNGGGVSVDAGPADIHVGLGS